ncbi:hypothetical protein [Photobacterium chitinilyticum]|uniref:Uncharacterized protein n=1 Tax=Photobacterium chitinilyticum TaxID=2485123 RepID=A0A444JHY7_9GAMM|nr:hypothetical protein [Photobacterium chitinilyticum]RWX52731.1 hypothetical protein EDI28_25760 [Photobacterium chitinilyticum]
MSTTNKNKDINCFVIMPISDQAGYDSGHFHLVYEDIICPAIKAAGMVPIRADESKGTNLIQLDILKRVIDSPITICDISSKNPNVFYELGMRQAFDLPTVLLKDDITDAPFDISVLRYCSYSKEMRHRQVLEAVKSLTDSLIETYNNRDNKSEINSLIRLLEISSPAQVPNNDLSGQEREEKLVSLKLDTILQGFENVTSQLRTLDTEVKMINNQTSQTPSPQPPSDLSGLLAARNKLRAQSARVQKNSESTINYDDV